MGYQLRTTPVLLTANSLVWFCGNLAQRLGRFMKISPFRPDASREEVIET